MIGHVFQSHYHTLQVQLFGGDSSNIEASLEHSNIGTTTSIQEKSAKWPTSQGGPLDDLQQYRTGATFHIGRVEYLILDGCNVPYRTGGISHIGWVRRSISDGWNIPYQTGGTFHVHFLPFYPLHLSLAMVPHQYMTRILSITTH